MEGGGDLQLLGLVASFDPARAGVKQAVQTAREGGIRVIMITGDYLKTAIAIAKNVEILDPEKELRSREALDCENIEILEIRKSC
jgi:P-type Ca2+ transporter type 2C